NGATFESVPGRRRTKPGQGLIRTHQEALNAVEGAVNLHVDAWRRGGVRPVGPALDAMYARWKALKVGESLRVDWPIRRIARIAESNPRRSAIRRPYAIVKRG